MNIERNGKYNEIYIMKQFCRELDKKAVNKQFG